MADCSRQCLNGFTGQKGWLADFYQAAFANQTREFSKFKGLYTKKTDGGAHVGC